MEIEVVRSNLASKISECQKVCVKIKLPIIRLSIVLFVLHCLGLV